MHNIATAGFVRTLNFSVAAPAGVVGNPDVSRNGNLIGVGIAQFVVENSGTRPIQVSRKLIINNGAFSNGTRAARLDLKLSHAPAVDMNGVVRSIFIDGTTGKKSKFPLYFAGLEDSKIQNVALENCAL